MILDIIVLAALLVSAIIAFLRGFIREALTILGVVGGIAASYFAGPLFSPLINGWLGSGENEEPQKIFGIIPHDMLADAIAYGSIFIIVVIVLSIASYLLSGWAKAVGLGAVDRMLGVLFGMVRGVVILALLYLPVPVLFDQETREGWFEGSKTHFYVEASSGWMAKFLPETLKEDTEKQAKKTAESMAKATREKLQEIDVLQKEAPPKKPALETEGYQKDERQDLKELFEDNLDE